MLLLLLASKCRHDGLDYPQREVDLALACVDDGEVAADGVGPHHHEEVREGGDAGAHVGGGYAVAYLVPL